MKLVSGTIPAEVLVLGTEVASSLLVNDWKEASMIKLYGSRPTRSTRAAWMLEELGLEYELIHDMDPRSAELVSSTRTGSCPPLSTTASQYGSRCP
jgi:hypothetical protein